MGGTRQRRFDGTHFRPRKPLENAQSPTSRVHAVLGGSFGVAGRQVAELLEPVEAARDDVALFVEFSDGRDSGCVWPPACRSLERSPTRCALAAS